jgi:hypothetical protein
MGRLRALAVVASCLWSVITLAGGAATTQRVDATTPLESRITDTPASVLKMFADAGEPAPTPHLLTADEQRTLAAAFAALPPLHRRMLRERLHSLSFLDGMPNTALTSPVNPGEAVTLYHWTIRAGVLHEHVSDWLTAKERTLFSADASPLSVSVEAGTMDAILYVLLHEGTHVVDGALGLTPAMPRGGSETPGRSTPFTAGVWSDRLVPVAAYRDALLEQLTFRRGGKPLRLDQARPLYLALQRTPFVSAYASTNWYDDLAETLSVYHLTERLKQPFRIVVRDAGHEVFAYEPAKSEAVRLRFAQLSKFYETDRP